MIYIIYIHMMYCYDMYLHNSTYITYIKLHMSRYVTLPYIALLHFFFNVTLHHITLSYLILIYHACKHTYTYVHTNIHT